PYGVAPSSNKQRFWRNSFSHFYASPGNKPRHTVEYHLDALRRVGVYPAESEKRLTLVAGDEADAAIMRRLQQHAVPASGFIHVHPASRWLFKCWAEDKMRMLIARLQAAGHLVVITAAPAAEEMAMIQRIIAPLPQPPVDLAGQLSLKQLAALSARARLFIGVDSAPMHIAAAMQTPTVALFGPSGDQEWGPWRVPSRIITADVSCRPCGNDGCGGGKVSECLQSLSVDAVLDAANALLAG
ncbi:MAG TPA: putative lipopolysaccharide heptosyltransferase III, partial [Betaproteobacteria bacterium]|nr:putative lipopolysaccharide heptosyltransferase III [Betaproteobacteria bacterium]